MTGDLMLAFFLVMPAIVVVTQARKMTQPVVRLTLFWGGLVACALALMVVIPMLACEGNLRSAYSGCVGAEIFTQAQPVLTMAAKIYILAGIPLGVFAYALEAFHRRGASQ